MTDVHQRVAGDPVGGAVIIAATTTAGWAVAQLALDGGIDVRVGVVIAVASFLVAYAIRHTAPA
jgi:hypothetical protein